MFVVNILYIQQCYILSNRTDYFFLLNRVFFVICETALQTFKTTNEKGKCCGSRRVYKYENVRFNVMDIFGWTLLFNTDHFQQRHSYEYSVDNS